MDDHARTNAAVSASQEPATQDAVHASPHAESHAGSTQSLTRGLFTLPEEEDTVVRAVPAQILALSRMSDETKTIPVPRELLELSRREAELPPPAHRQRDESELPVWDAWYGSDFQQEPVADLHPPQRVGGATVSSPQRGSDTLSADDLLLLEALLPGRSISARATLLMLAALAAAASCWLVQ